MTKIVGRRPFIAVLLLVFAFVLLVTQYHRSAWAMWDQKILFQVYNFSSSKVVDLFFISVTHMGSSIAMLLILLLCLYFCWQRGLHKLMFIFIFNFVGVRLCNQSLKWFFERERPFVEHMVEVHSFSFPSGHAMNAMAFFGFVAYVMCQYVKQRYHYFISGFMISLILIIGFSRVYLGVHFPSDVLAGWIAGYTCILISIMLYQFMMYHSVIVIANKVRQRGSFIHQDPHRVRITNK